MDKNEIRRIAKEKSEDAIYHVAAHLADYFSPGEIDDVTLEKIRDEMHKLALKLKK